MAATVERVLATRSSLRREAEAEAAKEAQLVSSSTNRTEKGTSEEEVPSLEELVAEKAEELRNRPHNPREEAGSPSRIGQEEDGRKASRGAEARPIADAGWPWPMDWLSAPPASPGSTEGLPVGIMFGGFTGGDADVEPNDGDWVDTPPFSIKVAAVEVVDVEDPDAAHVEVRTNTFPLRGKHKVLFPRHCWRKSIHGFVVPGRAKGEFERLAQAGLVAVELKVPSLRRGERQRCFVACSTFVVSF